MSHLGEFEQVILFSVLRLDDDACGVTIRDAIHGRTGRTVSSGAVYTTLGRLEQRGLVASRVEEASPGRPGRPRKYYRLEPAGARALMTSYNAIQAIGGDQIPRLSELAEQ